MKNAIRIGIAVLVVAAVVGVVVGLMSGGGEEENEVKVTFRPAGRTKRFADCKPNLGQARKVARPKPMPKEDRPPIPALDVDENDPELTVLEQKLMADLNDAVGQDEFKKILELNKRGSVSDKPRIRSAMVNALGYYGREALPELTPYLADKDDDVRFEARHEWKMALYEVESEEDRSILVESAMKVLTDEETLEDIANELIGIDDLQSIRTIANVIAQGTKESAAAAREAYTMVTGEDWTNVADAEKWLQENYIPPEPEEAE